MREISASKTESITDTAPMKCTIQLPPALHLFGVSILISCQVSSLAANQPGTLVSWGGNVIPYVEPGTRFKAIASGVGHNLALKSDRTVVAWGDNSSGQCNLPLGLGDVVALSAGGSQSLALKSDGTVLAWGNLVGWTGFNYGLSNVPVGLSGIVAVAA